MMGSWLHKNLDFQKLNNLTKELKIKALFIILFLCFNMFAGQTVLESEKPRIMLKSISQHAIHIGSGDAKIVYLFVDPMCKFSKRMITIINENKILQLTNSYYIFLYRLPRLDSEKLIQYIYQSEDPKTTIIDVMVDGDIIDLDKFEATEKTLKAIQSIAKVAKKLNIRVRPYIISFEKDSKYCKVSEGESSCLEEFED